jgi:hypothetical protein
VQPAERLGSVVPDEPGQQVGGEEDEAVRVPRPQRLPPPRLERDVLPARLRASRLDRALRPHPEAAPALLPSGGRVLTARRGRRNSPGSQPQQCLQKIRTREEGEQRTGGVAQRTRSTAEKSWRFSSRAAACCPGSTASAASYALRLKAGRRVEEAWAVTQSHSPWGPRVPWTCKRDRESCVCELFAHLRVRPR